MTSEALVIGATVTHAQAYPSLARIDPDLGEIMRRFGSAQVRASGTVGGNIANGSPIGDLAPALIALGSELELRQGDDSAHHSARRFLHRLSQAGPRCRASSCGG